MRKTVVPTILMIGQNIEIFLFDLVFILWLISFSISLYTIIFQSVICKWLPIHQRMSREKQNHHHSDDDGDEMANRTHKIHVCMLLSDTTILDETRHYRKFYLCIVKKP